MALTRLLLAVGLLLAASCSAPPRPQSGFGARGIEAATEWVARGEVPRIAAEALASQGAEGRAALRQRVEDDYETRKALWALASYNDVEAVHELGGLATDSSFPYRKTAAGAFSSVAVLWQDAAEPYWLALLRDETIDSVSLGMPHIAWDRPANAATLLAPLRRAEDPNVRERAERAYTFYVEQGGRDGREDLEVRVALVQTTYAYDDDIILTVELVNGGSLPAHVDTAHFNSLGYISESLKLELATPEGDVRTYPNHGYGPDGPGRGQTLEPGESVSTQIDIQGHCRPAQPGVYTITVSYGSMSQFVPVGRVAGLPPVVASNPVEFTLGAPGRAYVEGLLAEIALDTIGEERVQAPEPGAGPRRVFNRKRRDPLVYRSLSQPIYELGQLRDPTALESLRALVRLPEDLRDRLSGDDIVRVRYAVKHALARYDAPALVPMWVEMLGARDDLAERRLAEIGDPRAIEPLRAHAAASGDPAAARALAELGDDSVLRQLRKAAISDMDPDDESTWGKWHTPKALALLLPSETLVDRLRHEHPGVRSHALWMARLEGRVDILVRGLGDTDLRIRRQAMASLSDGYGPIDDEPGEQALRIDALKRALTDPDCEIRNAAAVGLSYQGDESGEALLRANLTARDYKTRGAARDAMRMLRQRR